jgi:hypothetical protein
MPRPIALLRGDEILEPPIILIEVLRYRRDNVLRPGDFSLSEFNISRLSLAPDTKMFPHRKMRSLHP